MKKTILTSRIILTLTSGVISNVNAALAPNAILDFDDGITSCVDGGIPPYGCNNGLTTVSIGSYFGLDSDGDGVIQNTERVALTSAGMGLTLGSTQNIGAIDNAWSYAGSSGYHYTKAAPAVISASDNIAIIDMSGWSVWWGYPAGDAIPNWATEATTATITCDIDCSVNDRFTFEYYIPGVIQDFGAIVNPYAVHLEGIVSSVPIPAATWLLCSGLVGLFGFAKRRNIKSILRYNFFRHITIR